MARTCYSFKQSNGGEKKNKLKKKKKRALGLSLMVGIHSLVPFGWGLGSMYTITDRISASINVYKPNYRHTGPDCTSIEELKNLDINYHLQSYVTDRSMVFLQNLGGC